jgi:hypothetical protein
MGTGVATTSPPSDPHRNIDGDGGVDILDLVLVSANFKKSGPVLWYSSGPRSNGAFSMKGEHYEQENPKAVGYFYGDILSNLVLHWLWSPKC